MSRCSEQFRPLTVFCRAGAGVVEFTGGGSKCLERIEIECAVGNEWVCYGQRKRWPLRYCDML